MPNAQDDDISNSSQANDEGTAVTASELLSHIRGQGYNDTSDSQIERWYENDCLPRPRQTYITGVRGSTSRFPAQAVAQALAICRLQRVRRYSFDELRILLWREGFQIPPDQVRLSLQRIIERLRDALHSHWKASWRDILEAAEGFAALILPHLARTLLGRHIKGKLSAADQASYLTMQFQLLLGGAPAFAAGDEYVAEDGKVVDIPLSELVVQIHGLERAQTDTLGGAKPWLPPDIAPTLIELARKQVFSFEYMLTVIQDATPCALERALADRHVMIDLFPEVVRGTRRSLVPTRSASACIARWRTGCRKMMRPIRRYKSWRLWSHASAAMATRWMS